MVIRRRAGVVGRGLGRRGLAGWMDGLDGWMSQLSLRPDTFYFVVDQENRRIR